MCAFNNNWHQVYDFNAFDDGDESHWTLIPAFAEAEERNLLPDLLPKHLEVSVEAEASIVPVTAGVRSPRDFACLVVLFSDGCEKSRARTLINTLTPHPVSPKVFCFFVFHLTRSSLSSPQLLQGAGVKTS